MNKLRLLVYSLTALLLAAVADLVRKMPILSRMNRNYSINIDV